jgi:LuxR family maltose regulon positive regulatory protein
MHDDLPTDLVESAVPGTAELGWLPPQTVAQNRPTTSRPAEPDQIRASHPKAPADRASPHVIRRAKLLRPRIGSGVIARPRLVERLTADLDHPLILVIGPAGFGKTTLLCEWLADSPCSTSWLSLDEDDGDLGAFVTHFVAALQTSIPGIGAATLDLLRSPRLPSPTILGATLCDDLIDLDRPVILVLDDYHAIAEPSIHDFVAALLRHPAPGLHLVLSARRDPALPLSLLRLHGHVAELRAADLRFTDEEAQTFLTGAVDIPLDGETLRFLQDRTEGWIAGLRLAALALRAEASADGLAQAFEFHGRQHVMDFLLDEVLARQPAPVQTFLLRTAIVDRVCPELADALLDTPLGLGGSQALLEGLARDHLYVVPLGEDRTWFRYHHLFRELLRHRLLIEVGETEVAALHARASAWYEAQGTIEKAIKHALDAGEATRAAEIVERHAAYALESAGFQTLSRWLALIPEALVFARPGLLVLLAWSMHHRALSAALRPLLSTARLLIDEGKSALPEATARALRGHIEALSIQAFAPHEDPERLVAWGRNALDLLPPEATLARGLATFGLAHGLRMQGAATEATQVFTELGEESRIGDATSHAGALLGLATLHLTRGDSVALDQTARALLTFGSERRFPYAVQWGRLLLGLAAYHRNELDRALDCFEAVVSDRAPATFFVLRDGMIGLGLTYQALGRRLDAQMIAAKLVETLIEADDLENIAIVQSFRIRLALRHGDNQDPHHWLAASPPCFDGELPTGLAIPALTRMQALLARGREDDVAQTLVEGQAALHRFQRFHHRLGEIETLGVLALAHRARGDRSAANDSLAQALALAEPGDLVRIFVDLGPRMAELVREFVQDHVTSPYLQRILIAFHEHSGGGAYATSIESGRSLPIARDRREMPEQLSERELEVLERLNRRLSNKEIAEELFISPLTVKRHASNIYNKLGVDNRRQAIRRSLELGLLPQY